jgi:hypothetical protein
MDAVDGITPDKAIFRIRKETPETDHEKRPTKMPTPFIPRHYLPELGQMIMYIKIGQRPDQQTG